MAEPKIYQRFDLSCDVMRERMKKDDRTLGSLRMDMGTVREELIAGGYDYFESSEVFSGVPMSVILGHEIGRRDNCKFAFTSVAIEERGLPYKSGVFYRQIRLGEGEWSAPVDVNRR